MTNKFNFNDPNTTDEELVVYLKHELEVAAMSLLNNKGRRNKDTPTTLKWTITLTEDELESIIQECIETDKEE